MNRVRKRAQRLPKETNSTAQRVDSVAVGRFDSWRPSEDYDHLYNRCTLQRRCGQTHCCQSGNVRRVPVAESIEVMIFVHIWSFYIKRRIDKPNG